MRAALWAGLLWLAACSTDKLALAPSRDVNFAGHWVLNEADSDDPQRVQLSQLAGNLRAGRASNGADGQGGRGGRGRPSAAPMPVGPGGPIAPGVGTLSEGLRWPGKALDITQLGGVLTLSSAGIKRVYKPAGGAARDRVTGARTRRDGPPVCGWDDQTLVVRADDPDEDGPPFEQRYSIAADGRRLVEVIAFEGGRSAGFTVSRVWERRDAASASDAP